MDAASRRIALVANPVSGRGRGVAALRELETELVARGAQVQALTTTKAGEARGMAAQNRHSFPLDLIGLKDGDGVVHLVVSNYIIYSI